MRLACRSCCSVVQPGLPSQAGKQSNGVLAGAHSRKNPAAAGEVPISNSQWLRGFPSEGYCIIITLLLHSAATCGSGPFFPALFFLQPLFDKQKVAELSVKYGGPSTQGSKLVVGHSDDEEGSDEGWGLTGADDDMPSAAGNARKRGPAKDKGKPGTKGGAAKGRKGGEQLHHHPALPLPHPHLTHTPPTPHPAGKGDDDSIPEDELPEDIFAGEEDELRPAAPVEVRVGLSFEFGRGLNPNQLAGRDWRGAVVRGHGRGHGLATQRHSHRVGPRFYMLCAVPSSL